MTAPDDTTAGLFGATREDLREAESLVGDVAGGGLARFGVEEPTSAPVLPTLLRALLLLAFLLLVPLLDDESDQSNSTSARQLAHHSTSC